MVRVAILEGRDNSDAEPDLMRKLAGDGRDLQDLSQKLTEFQRPCSDRRRLLVFVDYKKGRSDYEPSRHNFRTVPRCSHIRRRFR